MPTDKEINDAKDYLLLRLRTEDLAAKNLRDILESAARRIVAIARKYNIPPALFRFSADPSLHKEVLEVLATLRDALYDEIESLDTFPSEEGDYTATAVTAKNHGKTFRERLAIYTNRWGYEIEATIAAAGLQGVKDQNAILDGIRDYMDRPYDNPWVKASMGKGEAVRLRALPHFGSGTATASALALTLLLQQTVADGWMQNWMRLNSGKRGFYVMRGSSYPCELCDAVTGVWYPASETHILPVHPRCCCYMVFTNEI